ncbi:MAG: hypothetical protein ACF8PN_15100 [Phycisphaerales bacterium]
MGATKKFIPDADRDFASMARVFATQIAEDPALYSLSADDAAEISAIVAAYRDALALATWPGTRTTVTIIRKDTARAKAERIIRRHANAIRIDDSIDPVAKARILVRERPKRLKRRRCPQDPPYLRFVRSERGRVHVLESRAHFCAKSREKPHGAARLELFVELLAPGEPVPYEPGDRPWYLRSFTTSPMRVKFPKPDAPRLVVYWARWADTRGEVGRWSPTVVAGVEGWPMEVATRANENEPRVAA